MKRFIFALRVFAIIMVVFTALGCCFPAVRETLTLVFPDRFEDEGEMVENLHFPLLVGLLVVAEVRVVLLLLRKLPTDVISCVLGVLSTLWMAIIPTLLELQLFMGGLVFYQYQFTFFGTMAVVCCTLSFLANVLLCILGGCRRCE